MSHAPRAPCPRCRAPVHQPRLVPDPTVCSECARHEPTGAVERLARPHAVRSVQPSPYAAENADPPGLVDPMPCPGQSVCRAATHPPRRGAVPPGPSCGPRTRHRRSTACGARPPGAASQGPGHAPRHPVRTSCWPTAGTASRATRRAGGPRPGGTSRASGRRSNPRRARTTRTRVDGVTTRRSVVPTHQDGRRKWTAAHFWTG